MKHGYRNFPWPIHQIEKKLGHVFIENWYPFQRPTDPRIKFHPPIDGTQALYGPTQHMNCWHLKIQTSDIERNTIMPTPRDIFDLRSCTFNFWKVQFFFNKKFLYIFFTCIISIKSIITQTIILVFVYILTKLCQNPSNQGRIQTL